MSLEWRLVQAIRFRRESDVRALVASGADVNSFRRCTDNYIEFVDKTPLHIACCIGNGVGIVGILIEAGADVNQRTRIIDSDDAGETGASPLELAVTYCQRERHEIVKALLAAGANGERSYRYAVRHGCRHTLRLLLQHRVPMYLPEGWPRPRRVGEPARATWAYHDKVVAAGGYDALVKKHREILASIVDKVVEAKFGRRAPQEVCAHAALFIAPPGGS